MRDAVRGLEHRDKKSASMSDLRDCAQVAPVIRVASNLVARSQDNINLVRIKFYIIFILRYLTCRSKGLIPDVIWLYAATRHQRVSDARLDNG